jgi:hypothetical protein
MRADILPGRSFRDYELTDHTRTRRQLSELQGIDPMTLVLSRGSSRRGCRSPALRVQRGWAASRNQTQHGVW